MRSVQKFCIAAFYAALASLYARAEPNADLGFSVQSSEGVSFKAKIAAEAAEIRLFTSYPWRLNAKGFKLGTPGAAFGSILFDEALPWLTFGAVRPAGLIDYVYRPLKASITGMYSRALRLDVNDSPAAVGSALGKDCEAFAFIPRVNDELDTDRLSCGVYVPRLADCFSAMVMFTQQPPEKASTSWYSRAGYTSSRVFAAAAFDKRWKHISAAAFMGASASFPGNDALCGGCEFGARFWRMYMDVEAKFAGPAWQNPAGALSDAAQCAATIGYKGSNFNAAAGCNVLWSDMQQALPKSIDVKTSAMFYKGGYLASLSMDLSPPFQKKDQYKLRLENSVRLGFMDWFTFVHVWNIRDNKLASFDILAYIQFEKIVFVDIQCGLRSEPGIISFKAGIHIGYKAAAYRVKCGIATQGWLHGADWYKNLDGRVSFEYKLR